MFKIIRSVISLALALVLVGLFIKLNILIETYGLFPTMAFALAVCAVFLVVSGSHRYLPGFGVSDSGPHEGPSGDRQQGPKLPE